MNKEVSEKIDALNKLVQNRSEYPTVNEMLTNCGLDPTKILLDNVHGWNSERYEIHINN